MEVPMFNSWRKVVPGGVLLEKCMKNIKSAYGFDEYVSKALKFKTDEMRFINSTNCQWIN